MQKLLDENSKKDIKTLVSNFVPKSFANYFLKMLNINSELKCYEINSKIRDKIEDDPKNPIYLKTVRGLGYKIEKC